ncbi:MAG: TonB-dependent receptor [Saprospiraceae bacterium]
MKKINILLSVFLFSISSLFAQSANTGLKGKVLDENKDAIGYATITLFQVSDSTMAKAGYTADDGSFELTHIFPGSYYVNVSFVGYDTYVTPSFEVTENNIVEIENIKMAPFTMQLGEVVVAASKPLIEVKPDKTVFNVEGSVNSIGNNGLELLRKAPGVVVDNNDHLMLIGKSGVKVYIDGRQSILTGDDLSNYLKSLQSNQIEAIEIITQPSSRYEADGNAGIINIRLIKDKSLGTNAHVSLGYDQATHGRFDGNVSLNNRTQFVNVFGNYNYANGKNSEYNFFERTTSDLFANQQNNGGSAWDNHSLRAGVDFTASTNSTIGFLVDGFKNADERTSNIHTELSPSRSQAVTELLEATNRVQSDQKNFNLNGNYKFDNKKGTVLNIDADFGKYSSVENSYQPNFYYDPSNGQLTDQRIFSSNAPTDIDIKTFKLDYEKNLFGGTAGAGFKLALVNTDNNYEFYDIVDDIPVLNIDRTNRFKYAENVNAAYMNFNRQWKKIGFQFGLRVEQTDSKGDLTSQTPQNDETVKQDYTDVFPSGGLTYQLSQKHSLRLTYSRRIDRPNYKDLNPFESKLDELTFRKGNPFLRPQFSNSISLGHTFNYTLNTTLSYTHTKDLMSEITDTASMRAAFITTENIADQDVYSLSISYPFAVEKWWNVFANTSVSNTHNKADFGNGKIVDITATTFNIYMQHSFTLPKGFVFELSGWYNSPGIWGGNFATSSMYSIDAGISKKLWKERATIKLGVGDIFNSMHWSGVNNFGALALSARGGWESRKAKLNFTYLIGSKQVKGNRNRSTGLEDESRRIKGDK